MSGSPFTNMINMFNIFYIAGMSKQEISTINITDMFTKNNVPLLLSSTFCYIIGILLDIKYSFSFYRLFSYILLQFDKLTKKFACLMVVEQPNTSNIVC